MVDSNLFAPILPGTDLATEPDKTVERMLPCRHACSAFPEPRLRGRGAVTAIALNYMDRSALAVGNLKIRQEFGINATAIGAASPGPDSYWHWGLKRPSHWWARRCSSL